MAAASIAVTSCHGCQEPPDADRYPPQRTASRTEVAVVCGSSDPGATFVSGWDAAQDDLFRWSMGPRSRVDFFIRPTTNTYALTLEGSSHAEKAPQVVTVRLNGHEVASASFEVEQTRLMFRLGHDVLVDGRNSLELVYAWTAAERERAIQLRRFSVRRVIDRAVVDIDEVSRGMVLGAGWSRPDRPNGQPSLWTSAIESNVHALIAVESPKRYELFLEVESLPRVELEVVRGDEVIGKAPLKRGNFTTIPLAKASIQDGENDLRLRFRGPGVPSDSRERQDIRVQVARVELRPLESVRPDAGR